MLLPPEITFDTAIPAPTMTAADAMTDNTINGREKVREFAMVLFSVV